MVRVGEPAGQEVVVAVDPKPFPLKVELVWPSCENLPIFPRAVQVR